MRIFLLGMMGSGKSFHLPALAAAFDLPAYDLDRMIEQEAQNTVAGIFASEGEAGFRQREATALRSLAPLKKYVVATGGGTPCFNNNMEWMNEAGITVWLDESIDTLVQRLLPERAGRPLIRHLDEGTLPSFLEEKRNERLSFYVQAKIRLEGAHITTTQIIQALNTFNNA